MKGEHGQAQIEIGRFIENRRDSFSLFVLFCFSQLSGVLFRSFSHLDGIIFIGHIRRGPGIDDVGPTHRSKLGVGFTDRVLYAIAGSREPQVRLLSSLGLTSRTGRLHAISWQQEKSTALPKGRLRAGSRVVELYPTH